MDGNKIKEFFQTAGKKISDAFQKAGAGIQSFFSDRSSKKVYRPSRKDVEESTAAKKASGEPPVFDALEKERLARMKKLDEKKAPPQATIVSPVKKQEDTKPRKIETGGKVSPTARATGETVVFSEDPVRIHEKASLVDDETQPIPDVQLKHRIGMFFKPREKKPNLALSIILTVIKLAFIVVLVLVAVGFGSVIGVAKAYLETTPELDTEKIEDQSLTSYILYPDGSQLAIYTGSENRDWAALDDIPETMKNAIIAVEDRRFYEHDGVDYRRLAGAFAANLSSTTVEGGSTLTQQLVKNKLLSSEKSYKRKLQEAYLAMELERNYSKDEILEAYLNTIPLGGTVYGVKTAAKDYFGKELSQLTLKETVCIAAITQSTTRFNPRRATYVRPENLPYLIDRMNIITERMYWDKMITEDEYNDALIPTSEYLDQKESFIDEDGEKTLVLKRGYLQKWTREMNILTESPSNTVYPYPHFVEYVIRDVQSALLKKHGLEDTTENRKIVDKEMRQGGYRIYSTIDRDIQETVQSTIANWEDYPKFKDSSNDVLHLKDNNGNPIDVIQPQAAAAVVENDTGYLVAIVGSRTEPKDRLTFNRAADGKLPIGSSMKPIAVYGPAIDTGYGLASCVANIPVPITGWPVTEEDPGYPKTSSSWTVGPITLHDAIIHSQNIAAARTLADFVGIDTSLRYLENLGVNTEKFAPPIADVDNRTIVGLALGAAPMNPIEVSGAYSTIPRGGEYLQPVSFSHVLDSNNNMVIDNRVTNSAGNLLANPPEDRDVHRGLKTTTAWQLNKALSDAVDHGTGTRAKIDGMHTSGKTGTVVLNKGACFTGFTPYYTSCLWVGHDEYKQFQSSGDQASRVCAPLWKAYMTTIHEGLTDKEVFPMEPEFYGMVQASVCKYSNMKPGSSCHEVSTDWYAADDVPTVECDLCGKGSSGGTYCSESGMVAGPYCPTTYSKYWPNFPANSPYALWRGYSLDPETGEVITGSGGGGGAVCNIHTVDWYNAQIAAAATPEPTAKPTKKPKPDPDPTKTPKPADPDPEPTPAPPPPEPTPAPTPEPTPEPPPPEPPPAEPTPEPPPEEPAAVA